MLMTFSVNRRKKKDGKKKQCLGFDYDWKTNALHTFHRVRSPILRQDEITRFHTTHFITQIAKSTTDMQYREPLNARLWSIGKTQWSSGDY